MRYIYNYGNNNNKKQHKSTVKAFRYFYRFFQILDGKNMNRNLGCDGTHTASGEDCLKYQHFIRNLGRSLSIIGKFTMLKFSIQEIVIVT